MPIILVETRREVWKYAVVGAAGVLLDFSIFNMGLLLKIRILDLPPEIPAKFMALLVTSVLAFSIHKRWTFSGRISRSSQSVTVLKFGVALVIGGLVSMFVIWSFNLFPVQSIFWWLNATNLLAIGLSAIVRFMLTRNFVFNVKKSGLTGDGGQVGTF